MDVQFSVFSFVFTIAAAICAGLALFAWQRRRAPGGSYLALFMAAAAYWALCSALENSVVDMPTKVLFAKMSYPGVVSVAPLWLLFALGYSRHIEWLRSRWLVLIWIVPAICALLAFTNEWHHLIWTTIQPVPDALGGRLYYSLGPAIPVQATYAYVLLLAGSIILLDTSLRSSRRSRLPTATMVAGILFSLAANVAYGTSLDPVPGMDITPLAFTVSGLLFTWAVFGQRMLELVPVARDTLIQVMADGAIVLDGEGNVVEINPAAARILGVPGGWRSGGRAEEQWPTLAGYFRNAADAGGEIEIEGPEGSVWLEARVSVLRNDLGLPAGRLVVLRDVTKRKLAEEELKRSNEALVASLHEKEVLLKEIHHRVKNNLQIVSSILSLQSDNVGREGQLTALKDSQDRIRSMALIHEKLYQTRDISRVDFGEYTRSLAVYLSHSYLTDPGVSVTVRIENISLDIDQAIPCGLIINELVSNSLKYAFPDGRTGEICVALIRDGSRYELTVTDSGVGLPPGFNFRNTTSLGLQLVDMLTDQLEGTIEQQIGIGTAFKITFPE